MLTRVSIVSFGDREEWYAQAHLAILTALAWTPPPVEVVVTTDRADRYRWFGTHVRLVTLTPELIRDWSGPQEFVWRAVLKAIVETARRQPEANLLYLDVDTLVRKPLSAIIAAVESGDVFLERKESLLSERRGEHRELWKQVRERTFEGIHLDSTSEMWNSGVVAVGACNRHLLERSLRVCDAMTADGVQSRLTEQLAQTVVLRSTGRLREARAWIDHYWGNKDGYNQCVRQQLATILIRGMNVLEAIEYVREHPIRRPLRIKPRWWHRHLRRFAGVELVDARP